MIKLIDSYMTETWCDEIKSLQRADNEVQADFIYKTLDQRKVDLNTRNSKLTWLTKADYPDLHINLLTSLAFEFSKLDIRVDEFETNLQLTKYPIGGHYAWHTDYNSKNRRLGSFVLMLSKASEYQGGELQFEENNQKFKLTKGSLILFSSKMWHRVTPVTSGERVTLVGWLRQKGE